MNGPEVGGEGAAPTATADDAVMPMPTRGGWLELLDAPFMDSLFDGGRRGGRGHQVWPILAAPRGWRTACGLFTLRVGYAELHRWSFKPADAADRCQQCVRTITARRAS